MGRHLVEADQRKMAGKFIDQRRTDQAAASGNDDDFLVTHREASERLNTFLSSAAGFGRFDYRWGALPLVASIGSVVSLTHRQIDQAGNYLILVKVHQI